MIIFNGLGILDLFIMWTGQALGGELGGGDTVARIGAFLCFGLVFFWDIGRRISNADSTANRVDNGVYLLFAAISPTKGGMLFYIPTWALSIFLGYKSLIVGW
jgi:hypothetical protein